MAIPPRLIEVGVSLPMVDENQVDIVAAMKKKRKIVTEQKLQNYEPIFVYLLD
jgi:hypothetical protein